MLRARAFRQTNGKIVKIQVHPTHPWIVTADDTDHVSVWNWEHRQVPRFRFGFASNPESSIFFNVFGDFFVGDL